MKMQSRIDPLQSIPPWLLLLDCQFHSVFSLPFSSSTLLSSLSRFHVSSLCRSIPFHSASVVRRLQFARFFLPGLRLVRLPGSLASPTLPFSSLTRNLADSTVKRVYTLGDRF